MNDQHDRPAKFEEFIAWKRETSEERTQRERERATEYYAQVEREAAARRLEMARQLSNVGERFEERTLDAYQCPPGDAFALWTARNIAEWLPTKGAWFCGAGGTGKTHLAASVVNIAVEQGVAATYLPFAEFVEQVKASYDREGKLKSHCVDIIRQLASIDLLVIDDIDKTPFTKNTCTLLYRLINGRYERSSRKSKRPLIVTSNLEPAEIAIRWRKGGVDDVAGTSILDRLRELCGQFVAVEGQSYRTFLMENAS